MRKNQIIDKDQLPELLEDLTKIHYSHTDNDYKRNIAEFKTKYMKHYNACYKYCSNWFTGVWSNWQIFHNKPGKANTNSNIESFNNIIKKKITNRTKLTMCNAIKAIQKLVINSSYSFKFFYFLLGMF